MAELWDIRDANGVKTGRLHERGKPMRPGEYHLSITVWIANSHGELLISQRAPGKNRAGTWEPTGGAALAGEEAMDAALREVREELGLILDSERGMIFRVYKWPHSDGSGAAYITVWLFRQDSELSDLTLQPEETCDAAWVTPARIRELIAEGKFIDYTYLNELFETI
ncbi:MAG: NUDIX domain-containing protein [Clostridia bacterium]|nr:NUDIX domain-containing protein [Clostridia bacterium]